jgi:hydroxypyruvate isomerase
MERKEFLSKTLLAGGSLLAGGAASAAPAPGTPTKLAPVPAQAAAPASAPFHLNYGIHDGLFKAHAGPEFTDQIRFAYEQGFRAIEDNGMMDRPPEQQTRIGDTLQQLGMAMGVFVLNFDHWPVSTSLCSGDTAWTEKFLKACRESVDVARRCHGKYITVVPGNYDHKLAMGYQTANVIDTLRRGCEILEPHGLVMVLEALSDTPELFLRHPDQTYMICEAVNSPSCKYLFDMYHMQRNEGDLIPNIDRAYKHIAYFQIGDNPGRKEPGTGEMNYRNIFKHIYEKGYKGVLGMEHGMAGTGSEGEAALIKAYREADNFI